MNITTLLEIVQTTVQDKQFNGSLRRGSSPWDTPRPRKELGRGAYSSASTDPSDPHMVKKHHNSPLAAQLDPFSDWVKFIVDNKHQENPHFPKFYNIKKIKDKNDNYIYTFTIEKLESLRGDKVNMDIINAIMDRDFHNHDDFFRYMDRDSDSEPELCRDAASTMGETMKEAVLVGNFANIKSESLIEALHIVKEYYDAHKDSIERLYPDIHGGNIMFRRAAHGFTVVITDPFSAELP